MQRKMLGDTIYRLRKENGISQSQLGEAVGVSNKAVSKWETYEANPDISLLPILAKALGITTDELLTDIRVEKGDPKPVETKVLGVQGTVMETPEVYEFVSDRKRKDGLPYMHIHIGKTLSKALDVKARGTIAIGNNAKGIISVGIVSVGVISLGIFSLGLLSWGVLVLGLISIGSFAFGGLALGAIAVGVIAVGAIAIGFMAIGAVAIGYYAHTSPTGEAFGKHIFIHSSWAGKRGL